MLYFYMLYLLYVFAFEKVQLLNRLVVSLILLFRSSWAAPQDIKREFVYLWAFGFRVQGHFIPIGAF